jgi:DNA modification methylase
MNTELVPISDLTPDPANARKHGERNLSSIIDSLRAFGQQKPIVVDRRGVVIAGNGTLEAAKRLGWEEIAVVRTELDPTQATAFGIADNRTAELAEWDEDVLVSLLDSLDAETRDLMHFDEKELESMVPKATVEVVEDEVPEEVDPITKPGDLWLLGKHRLLCGDSTKAEDVERLMVGAKADLLLTDPPYGINADRQHFEGHGWVLREKTEWDKDRPSREAIEHARAMASEQIVWGGNYFTDYLPPSMGWLVWDKGQRDFSLADCELAWRSERKAARVFTYSRAKSNREERHHPTQKPVGLMAWCVEQSNDAKTIYDPFLGSGTTLIAAEQLGRKCYGMEISPTYCDVIVKRWENLTGETAVLEA